ncbi:helix-turn-helix transcriptional regulator [Cryobacterium cheniae]|uniref:Helix-turn-helix transcriptional regulator n=1 Tax=Cryobacterium cheniae TaxID=1259262 RepID=A0A4R8XLQ0_9MICO|nr:LuxR C-terminal-related transcriptional regulator [Cryobacterium cheniae]TFC75829.1 helix-turn-helix transcriptional regulator [Cryobacterium cheniae]
MTLVVLATKLFVPPPRSQSIFRPRLVDQLTAGIRAGRRLSLVSAPAGFGKTTLFVEWVAQTRQLDPTVRVAWVSLEQSDNDPARFLTYLAAALDRAYSDGGPADHDPRLSTEVTLTSLINKMSRDTQPTILFLDDFQLIEDPSVRDAVAFLLDHLPPTMHLAIASRSDPLLPLARLRASGDLTELRAADLRFTPDEAAAFLKHATGLSLTREDVAALETRTEGWIAGLQLAALSMRETADIPAFIGAFTGSNRFVIDYLIEEVLHQAPLHIREFLCQTAILDRLSGPLCDAVTGRTDSALMLQSLERANLFIVPLDDTRRWYRYHHLFADVLRSRLLMHGTDHVAALHRLASEWFEKNDLPDDAVKHAFEAADFPRAARVIEATIPAVRRSRQDATLLGWLATLPDDAQKHRPVLLVFSAWSSLLSGDISSADRQLTEAEHLLGAGSEDGAPAHESEPGEELQTLPVTIELYRASLALATGDLPGITLHAQRAFDAARPNDYLGLGAAAGLLGLASWANGDLESGVTTFRGSANNLRMAGNLTDALSTTMVVADMLRPLGRLREAERNYEDALQQSIAHGNDGQPTADLHAGISDLLRDRNELTLAKNHLEASHELGESALSHEHRYRWFLAMARVHEAEGEPDLALASLDQAGQHYRSGFLPEVRPIAGMKARIWIAQGRLPEARAWVEELKLTPADSADYAQEFGLITLARLLIAEHRDDPLGESLNVARALLDRLLRAAEAGGRLGSASEILVLQAIAFGVQGEASRALVPLERALAWAEPEGHVRLFVDEGPPMLALLRTAAGAGIRPDFVRQLSQALRDTEGACAPGAPIGTLSERELHVLRLLATELSGPEIARELYVSLNTMRTHTKHIFLKLGVSSRPAAVRRAEWWGLI